MLILVLIRIRTVDHDQGGEDMTHDDELLCDDEVSFLHNLTLQIHEPFSCRMIDQADQANLYSLTYYYDFLEISYYNMNDSNYVSSSLIRGIVSKQRIC